MRCRVVRGPRRPRTRGSATAAATALDVGTTGAARRCATAGRTRAAGRAEPGDRRIVTALFADLVDYVRMLAEHDPEEVRARVTARPGHDGRGDRALRRDPREVHRRRGVRGLRLAARPRRRRRPRGAGGAGDPRRPARRIGDGGEPLEVRIGIATGEVVAGAARPPRTATWA